MKRAITKVPQISEEEMAVNQWSGLNTFGPHADLKPGEFRAFSNFDNFGGYIKTRRGSQKLINASLPPGNLLSHVVFDTGDLEYAVVQIFFGLYSKFYFSVPTTFGVWEPVLDKFSGNPFQLALFNKPVDMFVSNGKIYLFHTGGNVIFEYDEDTQQIQSRKMGLSSPQISSIAPTLSPAGTIGKRIYAVEAIYKNTVSSPEVDLVASGPNRQRLVTTVQTFTEGRFAYAESTEPSNFAVSITNITNDGTLLLDSVNSSWTHLRLYRTKDLTALTNAVVTTDGEGGETEITGRLDEVYQVLEVTRSDYIAGVAAGIFTFPVDTVLDDDFPFPNSPIESDKLELVPFASATIGVFHRDRIWGSGVLNVPGPQGTYDLPAIESKIFYTPITDAFTQYSESMGVLNSVDADAGDGEEMIGLYVLREDLVGIKQGKTGRIPYGDPNRGWITEDNVIGIAKREHAQFVPNIGICAIVNDQNDFRIFGFDLQWKSNLFGLQLARPVREILKVFVTSDDLDFIYVNGKLMISGGTGIMLVLAAEQRKGWSLYQYPLNGKAEAMFTFNEGRQVCVLNAGEPGVEIEVEGLDTDYDLSSTLVVPITFDIITHRWQDNKGRSLIEQRYLSVVAILNTNLNCQPFLNGKTWDVPFTLLPDPQDYPSISSELRETEYQGYSRFKPVGNYIHYQITGFAPATIYSLMLNTLVQRGNIPRTFDPFEVLPTEQLPSWVEINPPNAKDAGNASRDTPSYGANDAGDASRITGNYTGDDAGNASRS